MDIADLKEPVEVYELAKGDSRAIVALLRSEAPIRRATREALADYFEGKLKNPIEAGRPRKSLFEKLWNNAPVEHYKRVAEYLKSKKSFQGNSRKLIEAVARKYNISPDSLENRIKRSKLSNKDTKKSRKKYPYF